MTLKKKMDQEMILAAKAKDKIRLSALRLLKSGLHNREIDLKRELNEAEFLQLLSSMVKQRKDSIEQFEKGGRTDLVEKESTELKVIQEFMPAPMSETELDAMIAEAIRETGAASIRDMGKVMAALMPKVTGKADGKMVGDKVKARLSVQGQ
ncbi:MAG: GatB/YqeY domain-containing protein [Proteobacteria bacterium]|nr:GatB/YqeY domain-containing protein [Pseudomonadota bacterium]MBU4581171.1 GatB/YqeY domain-containing protein [Pseudomonadota bacterium]MCG2740578.1 GatB/YqeY domain-containing protein [Syntrophaceae bacterium]